MKVYGGVVVSIHIFLTSTLAGGEWSASRPCRFTPGERAPDTRWLGSRVGPRRRGEEQILDPIGTRTPARSQLLYRPRS
jgi:hypothetical protein